MNAIRYYRKHVKKMTQEEFAAEINRILGSRYTKVNVSLWENNKHKPNNDVIRYISEKLDIEHTKVCKQLKIRDLCQFPPLEGQLKMFEKNELKLIT